MTKRNVLTTLLTAFFAVCAMSVFGQAANELQQTPAKEQVQQIAQKAQMQAKLQMRKNLQNWGNLNSTSKESYEFWTKVDQAKLTTEEKRYVTGMIEGMKEKLQSMGY